MTDEHRGFDYNTSIKDCTSEHKFNFSNNSDANKNIDEKSPAGLAEGRHTPLRFVNYNTNKIQKPLK